MAQVTLSIAGSDCSSGAGIQADLKTFSSMGVHGLTAVTCVVAETPHRVGSITPIPPQAVAEQVKMLSETYPIGALKTGMLYSPEHVEAVVEAIKNTPLSLAHLVVDPVMVASTGDSLMASDTAIAYKELLLPISTLFTPNIPEAEVLLGRKIKEEKDREIAVKELALQYHSACLLKGGHFLGTPKCVDILAAAGAIRTYSLPWIDIASAHGTGCTLSAAITANLAKGQMLPTAIRNAKDWLHRALTSSLHWKVDDLETLCINQAGI